jgi:hypothetical protein
LAPGRARATREAGKGPNTEIPACRLRVCRYAVAHSDSSAVLAASLPGGVMIFLRSTPCLSDKSIMGRARANSIEPDQKQGFVPWSRQIERVLGE